MLVAARILVGVLVGLIGIALWRSAADDDQMWWSVPSPRWLRRATRRTMAIVVVGVGAAIVLTAAR